MKGRARSVADLIATARSGVRLPVHVVARDDLRRIFISPHHHRALHRAVGEALRNVARHSGAGEAEVHVTVVRRGLVVHVVDRGRGLPPGTTENFGVTDSIRAPMEAVGGRADLRPTPGGGTTVQLSLDRVRPTLASALVQSHDLLRQATGDNHTLVRSLAWPLTLTWVYLAVRYSLKSPDTPELLALAFATSTVTALVARGFERRPPTPAGMCLLWVTLLALQVTGLALIPPGALLDYRSWTVGFCSVPVVVCCFVVPVRVALLFAAPHPVAVFGAYLLEPSLSAMTVPWGALNATLTAPLVAITLGWLLRRSGAHVEAEQSRLAEASAALAHTQARALASSLHLEHTRGVVLPWLAQVAGGHVDLAKTTTGRHARLLAHEARDDLYAPGFYDPSLRRRVSQFRAGGGIVDVRPGFGPGAARRLTGEILDELLPQLGPGTRVTLTPPTLPGGTTRVTIVPEEDAAWTPPCFSEADDRGVAVDSDEFRCVVTFLDRPTRTGECGERVVELSHEGEHGEHGPYGPSDSSHTPRASRDQGVSGGQP